LFAGRGVVILWSGFGGIIATMGGGDAAYGGTRASRTIAGGEG
jgi:hypothetical protein